MDEITVGVDIGGTKIQAAVVRGGEVVSAHRLMTPQRSAKELVSAMADARRLALAWSSVRRSMLWSRA